MAQFQEEKGLLKTFNDIVNFVFSNINCFKCGKVVRVIDDNKLEISFETNIEVNDKQEKQNTFIYEVMPSAIKYKYELNDYVIVVFFDYNEELFINNQQQKNISNNTIQYKHSLSNGYVVAKYNIESFLLFEKEKTTLKNNEGGNIVLEKDKITIDNDNNSSLAIEDKIELKNNQTNLKDVLIKLTDALTGIKDAITSLQITSPVGPCALVPTAYQKLIDAKIQPAIQEINKLLK